MDTKKVIEKLLKIAENQQKIITKLAQGQQHLDPNRPAHVSPGDAIKSKLPAAEQAKVALVRVTPAQGHFVVEYMSGNPGNVASLEDALAAATQAAQREGAPGVPKGQFLVQRATG